MEEARLAQNIKSSGNIKINKPSSGDLVYDKPSENGLYGPFNITYPSYLSSETGKQEFIGNEFVITVNDQELSYLPESGEDFYLTEADGIKIGEKNTLKIKYKGNYNYRGTWTRYTAIGVREGRIVCPECGETYGELYWYGFRDWHTGQEYYNEDSVEDVQRMECIECQRPLDVWFRTLYDKETQDIIVIAVTCDTVEEEQEIEFWPGRKIVINLDKTDNAVLANALADIEFDVDLTSGELSYFQTATGDRPSSM